MKLVSYGIIDYNSIELNYKLSENYLVRGLSKDNFLKDKIYGTCQLG